MSYETKNSLYVVKIVTFIRVYNHLFMFNIYLLSTYKMSKSVEDIDSKLWPQKVSVCRHHGYTLMRAHRPTKHQYIY